MYSVFVPQKQEKELAKIDEKIRNRIWALFETLETLPFPAREYDLKRLGGMQDCYRVRIGDYRVCYHVNKEERKITVFRVERRETAYQ